MDLTDSIRACVQQARRRGHVAMLDHALELLLDHDPSLVRGVLLDLRSELCKGLSWSPIEIEPMAVVHKGEAE